jgi:hypothetical protein
MSTPIRKLTRGQVAFLTGMPLLWAALLLLHPGGDGKEIYLDIEDKVTPWMAVHLGMLVFIPLMAGAVYLLTRGLEGTAVRVSRLGLALYVVFYGAFETLQGIGNGILVNAVNGLPDSDRTTTGAALVQDFGENVLIRDAGVFVSIGGLGFITATIAAGIALHRAGAPKSVPILLGLAGFLITAHPTPFGPTGLVLFVAAVVVHRRSQQGANRVLETTPAAA